MREFGSAKRLPAAPAVNSSAPIDAAWPTQIVVTSAFYGRNCRRSLAAGFNRICAGLGACRRFRRARVGLRGSRFGLVGFGVGGAQSFDFFGFQLCGSDDEIKGLLLSNLLFDAI